MISKKPKLLTASAVVIFFISLFTINVYAAGIQSYELGQPSIGTAGAGQAALADDASTAYFNPAGLTRLKRSEVLLGGGASITSMEFSSDAKNTRRGNDGGDAGSVFPSGGLYYAQKLSPKARVGLVLNTPVGLGLDYDDGWKGRYLVEENLLAVININPVLAYKVTDWLSLGGGCSLYYAYMKQDMALYNPVIPDGEIEMEFDDWAGGYNFGILLEPQKGTRIGAAYRSKVDFALEGDIDITGAGAIWNILGLESTYGKTDLTLPQNVIVSFYQQVFDNLALVFDTGWANWEEMEKTEITTSSGSAVTIKRDWKDTWRIGLGAHIKVADPLLFKIGFSYDSDPVASDSDRLPDMPVDRQWRYGAGLEYNLNENSNICLNYEFIDLGSAPINSQVVSGGRILSGDYNQHVNVLGFSFNWKFGK